MVPLYFLMLICTGTAVTKTLGGGRGEQRCLEINIFQLFPVCLLVHVPVRSKLLSCDSDLFQRQYLYETIK